MKGLATEALDGSVLPGVASSWTVNEAGTEYTFRLRPMQSGRTAHQSALKTLSRPGGELLIENARRQWRIPFDQ